MVSPSPQSRSTQSVDSMPLSIEIWPSISRSESSPSIPPSPGARTPFHSSYEDSLIVSSPSLDAEIPRKRARNAVTEHAVMSRRGSESSHQSHGFDESDLQVSVQRESSETCQVKNRSAMDRQSTAESDKKSFEELAFFGSEENQGSIDVAPSSRDIHFGRHSAKERELKRLLEVLQILAVSCTSRELSEKLLATAVVRAEYSHYQLVEYAKERCGVDAYFLPMCPEGHMVASGPLHGAVRCKSPGCKRGVGLDNTFWYCKPSEQLRALCLEDKSFQELADGCKRAHTALIHENPTVLFDYYDGTMFRDRFTEVMSIYDPELHLFVFLNMSTDGFEVFTGPQGEHSCWPLLFTVLNIGCEHRFRAANCILSGFIPGSHDPDYFETFIIPFIEDLKELEKGIFVTCADRKRRMLRGFLFCFTSDWPAGTKLSGYAGHMAKKPCRYCHKTCVGRNLVPIGSMEIRRLAMKGGPGFVGWMNLECPNPRTNHQTEAAWDLLDREFKYEPLYAGKANSKITRETGIKRRPQISQLRIDFCNAFPYDPMHLCLLGWVRHLLDLCLGIHDKTRSSKSKFIVNKGVVMEINLSLEEAARGFPTSWGRAPPRLDKRYMYKAETFKSFALYYATIVFSGRGIDRRLTTLWKHTRDILEIVHDPTPPTAAIRHLTILVQQAHALFTDLFFIDQDHAFCFTPSTHAILHLPEMLEASGPLLNVSQFLPERLIGELGKHAKSRARPEANLFHSSRKLFAFRMVSGGLRGDLGQHESANDNDIELGCRTSKSATYLEAGMAQRALCNGENDYIFSKRPCLAPGKLLGKGEELKTSDTVLATKLLSVLKAFLRLTSGEDIRILCLRSHNRARLGEHPVQFDIESSGAYTRRELEQSRQRFIARQKCWIAAEYESDHEHSDEIDQSLPQDDKCRDVYYGRIHNLLMVTVGFSRRGEKENIVDIKLASIEWQKGLQYGQASGTVSTRLKGKRKGSVKDTSETIEPLSCVKRVIGFFDHLGRRYFLDTVRKDIFDAKILNLRGIRSE